MESVFIIFRQSATSISILKQEKRVSFYNNLNEVIKEGLIVDKQILRTD